MLAVHSTHTKAQANVMNKSFPHSRPVHWVCSFILALSLTACGSGGGSDGVGTGTEQLTDAGLVNPVGGTGLPVVPLTPNSVVPGAALPANPQGGTTGGSVPVSGPTILSASPSQGALNVPLSIVGVNNTLSPTSITATFSEAMNPATLVSPGTTFTVKSNLSGQSVQGLVSLNANNTVATLAPTSALLANTQYTATITTAATSMGGVPLVSNYAWVFTTGASGSIGQAPIDLGAAAAYAALGGASIESFSTAAQPTQVNGQLGVFQTSTTVVKGFTDSTPAGTGIILTGGIQTTPAMAPVESDFIKAVLLATNRALNQTRIGTTDLALTQVGASMPGTFPPGMYSSGSATLMLNAGNLTLDAEGNPDAVWVFKADSSLIVGNTRQIILTNGARANQVFWVVGSSVTVGDQVAFKGNILAGSSITLGSAALAGTTLEGRAMSVTSLNLYSAILNKPLP